VAGDEDSIEFTATFGAHHVGVEPGLPGGLNLRSARIHGHDIASKIDQFFRHGPVSEPGESCSGAPSARFVRVGVPMAARRRPTTVSRSSVFSNPAETRFSKRTGRVDLRVHE
jgi:hypothetical protein